MKNRFLTFIIAILVLTYSITLENSCAGIKKDTKLQELPDIAASSAVVMSPITGEIVYAKEMDARKEPASTTKIMTALLAVSNLDMDRVVTIDREVEETQGSSLNLVAGERIKVKDLLYGLLLKSGNDAAVALAKATAGTTQDFAKMMNDKAKQLGMKNTHFVNPNGLPDDEHYSSAKDLAILTKTAMKNEAIAECVKTVNYAIPQTNKSEERSIKNTNRLLFDKKTEVEINGKKHTVKYKYIKGFKTGYTPEAGGCLVSTAKKHKDEYIAVVLGSSKEGRFTDSIALLDWVFSNYKHTRIVKAGYGKALDVKSGKEKSVKISIKQDIYMVAPKSLKDSKFEKKLVYDELIAPIKKGEKLAKLNIYYDGELLRSIPAYANNSVEKAGIIDIILEHILLIIVLIVVSLILIRIYNVQRARKKRRKKRRKTQKIDR